MLDMYPVYLKLGWKHSVSCVSRTSQTRNTHHRRRCSRRRACHDWCGSRRTNGQQRLGHELVLGLGSGRDAAGTRRTVRIGVGRWRHRRLPTTSLCSVGPSNLYLYSYLSILCTCVSGCVSVCICFQDRNTQIHAYPHPSPSVSNI